MRKPNLTLLTALALAIVALPALAQDGNTLGWDPDGPMTRTSHQVTLSGSMTGPGWVQSYTVSCSGKARLVVEIRDCCIPGDHFEASARSWDEKPTTIRMLASGSTSNYTRGVLRSFGADPLRALVNVRYLHGINIFSAGFYVRLTCYPSTSTITYTDQGQVLDTSK